MIMTVELARARPITYALAKVLPYHEIDTEKKCHGRSERRHLHENAEFLHAKCH